MIYALSSPLNSPLTRDTAPLSLEPVAKETAPEKLTAAGKELESLFWLYLVRSMRSAIPKSDLLPGQNSQRLYNDLVDEQLARVLAENYQGVSGLITRQFEQ